MWEQEPLSNNDIGGMNRARDNGAVRFHHAKGNKSPTYTHIHYI